MADDIVEDEKDLEQHESPSTNQQAKTTSSNVCHQVEYKWTGLEQFKLFVSLISSDGRYTDDTDFVSASQANFQQQTGPTDIYGHIARNKNTFNHKLCVECCSLGQKSK